MSTANSPTMSVSPNFAFAQDGEDASEEDRRQQRYVDAKERWKSNPKPGHPRLEESEDEEASTDRRVRQRRQQGRACKGKKPPCPVQRGLLFAPPISNPPQSLAPRIPCNEPAGLTSLATCKRNPDIKQRNSHLKCPQYYSAAQLKERQYFEEVKSEHIAEMRLISPST
ncbi:hypothetical protein BDZ89DRAFT_1055401 [Hymenopellis radicata]|nr:hypothetical protein BDZ89DRAFT_1055401 [Hymenopellis radicata]